MAKKDKKSPKSKSIGARRPKLPPKKSKNKRK